MTTYFEAYQILDKAYGLIFVISSTDRKLVFCKNSLKTYIFVNNFWFITPHFEMDTIFGIYIKFSLIWDPTWLYLDNSMIVFTSSDISKNAQNHMFSSKKINLPCIPHLKTSTIFGIYIKYSVIWNLTWL